MYTPYPPRHFLPSSGPPTHGGVSSCGWPRRYKTRSDPEGAAWLRAHGTALHPLLIGNGEHTLSPIHFAVTYPWSPSRGAAHSQPRTNTIPGPGPDASSSSSPSVPARAAGTNSTPSPPSPPARAPRPHRLRELRTAALQAFRIDIAIDALRLVLTDSDVRAWPALRVTGLTIAPIRPSPTCTYRRSRNSPCAAYACAAHRESKAAPRCRDRFGFVRIRTEGPRISPGRHAGQRPCAASDGRGPSASVSYARRAPVLVAAVLTATFPRLPASAVHTYPTKGRPGTRSCERRWRRA
ncbi:hypothetical protein B0H11DRAFT_205053 [Mycena galericulata]|nr:hypothetical protein B0H11DRAFT_205053 [Mycena galericulata]